MPEKRTRIQAKSQKALAFDKLAGDFRKISWQFRIIPGRMDGGLCQMWPGTEDEAVVVCVFRDKEMGEIFHRQDFFFFNFAYQGDYGAVAGEKREEIVLRENECCIGQPYAGYAIQDRTEKEKTIIGILIRSKDFFDHFFHVLAQDKDLFSFFLHPKQNAYANSFLHLKTGQPEKVRALLELMVTEYAFPNENTQAVLKHLTLALLLLLAGDFRKAAEEEEKNTNLLSQIVRYVEGHADRVRLSDLSEKFGLHPNYISALISEKLGKTFAELRTEVRMEKAERLLSGTSMPVEEVALMLGYPQTSNFYRAFRKHFGRSPRGKDEQKRENLSE